MAKAAKKGARKAAKKGAKKSSTRGAKTGAKRGAKKGAKKSAKRGSAKRELISPRGDKRYIRRKSGRINESDDQGRSLSQDRRRKAKTKAKPGQGDKGDR